MRLNGRIIDQPTPLRDGDRIGIGTQELVFSVVRRSQPAGVGKPTEHLVACPSCGTRRPETGPCPHCGAPALDPDETAAGPPSESMRNWAYELFGEVLDQALQMGRRTEADRLLRRIAREIEARAKRGEALPPTQLAQVGAYAARHARLTGSSEWVAWSLALHRSERRGLADDVVDRFEELDLDRMDGARAALKDYLRWAESAAEVREPGLEQRQARLRKLLGK